MKLETIYTLRYIIIAFMCYIPIVSIAGWFEAFIAKKLGDTVPERAGFLTFSPFVHFNPWGFFLMFADFPAFGKVVPLTPEVFMGRAKELRALGEFLARPFIHFCMMLISFVILIKVYHAVFLGIEQGFTMGTPLSSLQLTLCSLVGFFFKQNFILFIVYLFVALFRFVMYFYFPNFQINFVWTIIILLLCFFIVSILLGMIAQMFAQKFLFFLQSILQ